MQKTALLGLLLAICSLNSSGQPLDGVVQRTLTAERQALPYSPVREADVMWEKRVWRLIDTREKMNLAFTYPKEPFFDILKRGLLSGALTAYEVADNDFGPAVNDIQSLLIRNDTFERIDPETWEVELFVVNDTLFHEDIKRYRIKEIWFFEAATATFRSRILGIAPLREVYDEAGNFRYEMPLFWIYFPNARKYLAQYPFFNDFNDANPLSWTDLFDMRLFSSTILKVSNIRDNRIKDVYSGLDRLLEAEKLKDELFNYEHDLWSY